MYAVRKANGAKSTKNKNPNKINKNPIINSRIDLPVDKLHNVNALNITTKPKDIKVTPAIIDTTPALTNG